MKTVNNTIGFYPEYGGLVFTVAGTPFTAQPYGSEWPGVIRVPVIEDGTHHEVKFLRPWDTNTDVETWQYLATVSFDEHSTVSYIHVFIRRL